MRGSQNKKKQQVEILKKKLATQEKRLSCINMDSPKAINLIEKINQKINEIKKQLSTFQEVKIQGAILRTQSQYYEQGEKSTKYFFNLEKAKGKAKTITRLKVGDGYIVQAKQILEEQRQFYKSLYTKDKNTKFAIDIEPEKKVPQEIANEIEGPLMIDELAQALKSMKRNKAPGPCGITADFYMVFWERIKHILLDAFNECFKVKRMYPSARRGVITLLPKSGQDLLLLKNWRPIILLPTEYKILAKAIANRVKKALECVLHNNQTGFRAGKSISQNIRRVIDTIEYGQRQKIQGMLILIDFEKAFDRVDYNSLQEVLKWLNFGTVIRQWVNILFKDYNLCTVNNGNSSSYFVPTRVLFQGNPISSLGFLAIIELLAIMIRKNKQIEGISIGNIQQLLSLFADDMSICIPHKERVWKEIQYTLNKFQVLSGLKVNYKKSVVFRLGEYKTNAKFYSMSKLKWTDKVVNILGVWVGKNMEQAMNLNFDSLFKKAQTTLDMWQMRDLSLMGKILVINTLIASLFYYRMTTMPLWSDQQVKEFENMIKKFVWNKKRAKIPQRILQGNKKDGGLALVNIKIRDIVQKVTWVKKLLAKNGDEVSKELAYFLMENSIGDYIWKVNLTVKDACMLVNKNQFWRDMLISWVQFNKQEVCTSTQVLSQQLWLNSNIRIENKPICYKKWFDAGIICIQDLVNEDQSFLSINQLKRKYHLNIMFTEYMGIIDAIPARWKCWLRSKKTQKKEIYKISQIQSIDKVAGWVYHELNKESNKEEALLANMVQRWINAGIETDLHEFKLIVNRIYFATNYTKYRSFQYRILMRAIVTNKHLQRYSIKQSNVCTFCESKPETIEHLFWECTIVKKFWNEVRHHFNMQMHLNVKNILFNIANSNPKVVENLILLIAKYHIYASKCFGTKPSIIAFINLIERTKQIEENIAKNNNKSYAHNKKWGTK